VAKAPVEDQKRSPAQTEVPDIWQSFRSEMDRLFDRFIGSFGFPPLRRVFDIEQFEDEGEAAEAFEAAAADLLSAVNDTLAEVRQGREEARELLSRLEARLASPDG